MKKTREQTSLPVIEFDREDDGRWIAEIAALPGVMAYGTTKEEARRNVGALALLTLADRIDHGEDVKGIVKE